MRRSAGIDLDLDRCRRSPGETNTDGEGGVAAVAGIEGRFAHQAVHADLGAQPAEGIIALEVDGGALDAGDLAGRDLHQLGLEAAPLAPAQIHAQQHLGPVLRLGAAGAGLDVDEGVVGVHARRRTCGGTRASRPARSAPARSAASDCDRSASSSSSAAIASSSSASASAAVELVERVDDRLQRGALAPQRLGALGSFQTLGFLQLAQDFGQALLLDRRSQRYPLRLSARAPRSFS